MGQYRGKVVGWELNKLFPFGRQRGDDREQSTSLPHRHGWSRATFWMVDPARMHLHPMALARGYMVRGLGEKLR